MILFFKHGEQDHKAHKINNSLVSAGRNNKLLSQICLTSTRASITQSVAQNMEVGYLLTNLKSLKIYQACVKIVLILSSTAFCVHSPLIYVISQNVLCLDMISPIISSIHNHINIYAN